MATALSAAQSLRFDRVEVRPQERRILVDRQATPLGARAFDVLLALIERRDRLVTKSELLDAVWPDTVVEENNLQVHISALRKLLGPSAIATIPGRGYRFAAALDDDADARPAPSVSRPADLPPTAPGATNLPAANDPLIGRDADVQALTARLASNRLVTVLGAGGIGKTRVALEVARGQVGKRAQGTWWVDLAAIASPDRIGTTVAKAACLQLGEGDAPDKLAHALAHSDVLLVLDNCEHLVAGVARIAQALLDRAPGVSVMTTSQTPLKLPGEYVYRLGTLDTPPPGSDLATARASSALQLLERRAQTADRRFTLNEGNVTGAVAICCALEGVALAIEMAAVRLPWMGVDAVRAHLADRFRLLTAPNRIADGRHQTLRGTLDWSHALLLDDEQIALRRLAAFVGSFGLESAQQVVSDHELDTWRVLDALAGLVDKSLLHVEQLEPPRYRLLETTRLYAVERLTDAGEIEVVRRRHGAALAALAQQAMADSWTMTDSAWEARYAPDYEDLQAAFEHAAQAGDPAVVAETCEVLRTIDMRRGVVAGLRARMHAAYALTAHASGRLAARLWDCVTPSDQIAIDAIPRLDVAKQRLAAWRERDDAPALYRALLSWADEQARAGDFVLADAGLAEATAMERPDWPARLRMLLPTQCGSIAMYRKDADGYRTSRRQVLALAEQAGATRSATSARLGLGDAALLAEDYEEAATLCRAVVAEVRGMHRPFVLGIALENLSDALVHLGDLPGALAAAAESLPLMRQNEAGADVFNILALIAVRSGQVELAARMLGHVDAWVASSQYGLAPNEARAAEEAGKEIDAAIGPSEHARLRKQAATMTDAEADALVRAMVAGR